MLGNLPPEVLKPIFNQLPKNDLKSLSITSKTIRASALKLLWSSVTIKPSTPEDNTLPLIKVAGFPPPCVQHISHLHFRCPPGHNPSETRCMHTRNVSDSEMSLSGIQEFPATSKGKSKMLLDDDETCFNRLARQAISLIEQLDENKLKGFSWDLGICAPAAILGTNGLIGSKHPSIESLSLSTNNDCPEAKGQEYEIDLSPFKGLRSLHWRSRRVDHLNDLMLVIRNNAAHLEQLDLDFVDFSRLWDDTIDWLYPTTIPDDIMLVVHMILGLHATKPQREPLFPELRILSLTHVGLMDIYVDELLNLRLLESLTLRECPRWDFFINSIVKMDLPIRLKKLEIHLFRPGGVPVEDFQRLLCRVIVMANELEDLFLCLPGFGQSDISTIRRYNFWNAISLRRYTLKRLVCHFRGLDQTVYRTPCDLDNLDMIKGAYFGSLESEERKSPFLPLDGLEFLGLCCAPKYLKPLTEVFCQKWLKVLHIRQSASDLECFESWARDEYYSHEYQYQFMSDDNSQSAQNEEAAEVKLTDEFHEFAEWAFGAEGIQSLELLVFGDFCPSRHAMLGPNTDPIVLVRDWEFERGFRIVDGDVETLSILHGYRDALEACPIGYPSDVADL